MKTYVTFGKRDFTKIAGVIYDKKCVAIIMHDGKLSSSEVAETVFDDHFLLAVDEDNWVDDNIKDYANGYIEVGL